MKKERICDDRPIEPSDKIKNMTEDELELEFDRLFGDLIDD